MARNFDFVFRDALDGPTESTAAPYYRGRPSAKDTSGFAIESAAVVCVLSLLCSTTAQLKMLTARFIPTDAPLVAAAAELKAAVAVFCSRSLRITGPRGRHSGGAAIARVLDAERNTTICLAPDYHDEMATLKSANGVGSGRRARARAAGSVLRRCAPCWVYR